MKTPVILAALAIIALFTIYAFDILSPRFSYTGNTTIGNITFHFVPSCALNKSTLMSEYNLTDCGGWTNYKQIWIVATNTSLRTIKRTCNHELYHFYSNTTAAKDHEYLLTAPPLPSFSQCNSLEQLLTRKV